MTLRWGFLATGRIAATVAGDLAHVEGASAYAVASRSLARAEAFAAEHGFERAYGSYEDLLADPDVDVVYVATPHAQHHKVVSAVVAAGKPVLVEKSFTVSAASAEDLVARVRAAGVFAMEAMWTRFLPSTVRLREILAAGEIGEVRCVQADLGFVGPTDPTDRLLDPAQGGGALLDVGVYPVSFAQLVLGAPATVTARSVIGATGVDLETSLLQTYDSGATALLHCSVVTDVPGRATVIGTAGHVVLEPRFHHATTLTVSRGGDRDGSAPSVEEVPLVGTGYGYQLEEVARCLAAGRLESDVMPLSDTLAVMRTLDEALEQVGAVHVDEGFTP